MGHRFERVRMEPLADGSVNIGVAIIATLGATDTADPDFGSSAQWVRCGVDHVHAWDICNVRALFGTREKDAQGAEIVGTSARERLVAWLQAQRAEKALNLPKEIPLPTRTVTKQVDGKPVDVDEPIRDISLT